MAIKITNLDSIKGSGVKNPEPLRQNWYSGDSPTTRDVLGRISEIYDHNKLAGTFYSNQFFKLQQDSSSPFYDPYASATNKAVNELASYGVDTSVIDDKFFRDNDYLRSYLNYNGSTNTPSAPGKKASTAEKAAYAFYQIWKSEDKTKKAESQWNALQDELTYWAKRTDRNYTDDEIINKVDWSKYGELTSMDTNKLMQPNEYNRAIGYSKDAMYGVIWAARNNGGTGDVFSDMAMSARGKGNTWQYNPEISAKLDPQNEQFLPYALGSTNLDDEAYLFGVPSFSKEWIAQNNGLQYEDSEKGKAFRNVMSAENDTVSAETALEGLNKWIDQNKSKWDTQEEAQAALDKVLAKGTLTIGKGKDKTQYDLSILNRIDATIGKNGEAGTGNLIAFNRPIDYKYDNVVRGFGDIVAANNQTPDGLQTANNLSDDITSTEPKPVKAPETKAPSANDGIDAVSGADTAARKPGDQTGVRTPTDLAPVNYTDSEIEQIKVKDKKISEASGIVDDVATENESTVMKNAGSVAFFGNKDRFSWIRNNAVSNQRFADGLTNISAKNLMSEGLGKAHSVAEYSNVEANYAADQQLFNQYRQKYGDLQYLQKEFKPTMTLTLEGADGDTYNVTLTYQDMNKGYQISDVVNTNYVFGESESGNDPGIYEQANAIAREQTAEAKKILYAQKNVHDNYGEAGEKEVEEYKTLSARIHNEESYLADNKEANDQNIAALKKSIEKMEMQYDAMTKEGLDTSGIKRSYDLLNNVLNYHDEPQLPRSTMTKLQYTDVVSQLVGEEYDTEKKSELLHRSINNVDEKIRQIQDDIDYAKAHGIEIPERYLHNMQLTIEDLEADRKGFEYSAILTDTDPEELDKAIEAGKEFEKYVIDNVLIDDNIIHPAYGFEHLQQVATEEDQKIYYYLLGRQALEHGDEYQTLLHSNNPDDVLTKSGELMESIMKDSSDYLDFMLDDDYGVWTSRRAEANKEEAKAMVDSGFGGGLIANVASTILTPIESLSSAIYILDRAIEGKRINPDSKFRSVTQFKESTRAETRASIEEAYKDKPTLKYLANLGYEIYCNRGDSAMNSLLTGAVIQGSGMLAEFAGASPMGATAALTAAANAIENGASTEQAWLIAGMTFIAETATEAITYSNIREAFGVKDALTKESLKQFTIDWLTKSGVEEMIGETTNDVVENWADRMATEWFDNPNYQSEHQQLVDSYYAQGYTGEGEAETKALEDEMKGYLHTAFVSYISAGTDVMVKAGKAAFNTARTAANVVNDYRSYTKARQKIGIGNSMFDYMKRDISDAMAQRTQEQNTQEASAQEAGVAMPSETAEAQAPMTAEERYNQAVGTQRTASDALEIAEEEYKQAYKNKRSKQKELNKARQEYQNATKSGDQDRIKSAKVALDIAQENNNMAREEYNNSYARRQEARKTASNAVAALEESEEAYEAERATPEQKQAAADVTALGRVEGSAQTAQTEMVASILDDGEGDTAVSDQANAAATFMPTVLGNDSTFVIQQVITGASRMGIDQATVKTALRNAALGNGAATAVVQSEQFQNASPEQKAQMLAETIEQDQNNPDVQQNIAAKVNDFRSGMVINDLAAQGHFDQAQQAQDKADAAAVETAKAETQLQEKQDALDEATRDVEQKAQAVAENPTDDNMKQHADAVTRADNADESRKQYEEHLAKQQEAQKEAEVKAQQAKDDAMASARETASQTVAQQDQQRTEEAAVQAEQQRQQEEAAAKAKAEQDEMTGKADEDRRNALIEEALDRENLQGEKRETRREQLKKQLNKVKIKITDLGKSVSNTEGRLALYAFERKLGVPIVFDDLGPVNSKHITRGQYVYNEKTGEAKIVINENLIKAGKMTVGQAIVEAALHEVLHSVRATGAYNTYRHVVTEALYGNKSNLDPTELYKQNIAYRAAIDDMIADRKAAGDKNFQDNVKLEDKIKLADEEIVADFARLNLADKDVVQRFMDAGMGGKMRNILHNINQALKNYGEKISGKRYEQWKAQTEQQNREIEQWNAEHPDQQRELIDIKSREEFNKNLEYLRRAERAYQKAMEEAAKTNIHPNSNMMSVSQIAESTKLGMVVNDDTLELYMPSENGDIIGDGNNGLEKGKRYVLMDGVTPGRKITADMIVDTPVGMLIDMGLDNTEFTDEQGNKRTQQGDARQMFADLMNLCARYKDNNLIWEIAGSEFSEAFSALKSNSDPQYKNTVDFGTICSKTQAIVDVLSQTMVDRVNAIRQWNEEHAAEIEAGTAEKRIFTGLTREDIMEVYDRTHNAGLSVPCPVCYVFSRWMGVPGMLGQMNRFQNEYVTLAKGEDGKTLYDENGDAVVDWDETFKKANGYLLDMVHEYTKTKDNPNGIDITDPNLTLEERKAAIKAAKDKIADQKNSINNKIRGRQKTIKNLGEEIGILQEKLQRQDLKESDRKKTEAKIKKDEEAIKKKNREIDQFEEDKKKFEAFNWVSQVLCLQHSEGRATVNDLDENGNFVMDKDNFRYTPEEILFDLNRSGEFAGYAKNWRYRTTRGAGMGKAIMPYSGASIGDIIHGEAIRWREGQNPLLNMDKAAAEKAFKSAQKRVKQQNLVGGQRFQSTSDFRPEWGLDYIMSFLEMQALGSKVQMYTKVAEAVDFLGSIGADVNLSIMAKNNGFHEATAEELALAEQDTDEGRDLKSRMGTLDGKTYVMEFSDVTGMDYATAKGKTKKFNNVQMILVGMNDVHIKLALGNQDIDFVIPWHSSGNSKDVLQQLVSSVGENLLESSDYTDSQTDQIKSHKEGKGKNEKTIDDRTQDEIKLWDARVKLLTEGGDALTQEERNILLGNEFTRDLYNRFTTPKGEKGYDPDCYGVTLTKDQAEQVFPYEYWDKTSTRENADVNGQRFVEYCDALGLVPRFSQFKDVPGYWKLLIDRKMYDNNVLNDDGTVKEYGKYRDQKVVDVTKARMDNDPNQALDPATDRKKQVYQLPESTTAKYGRKQYKQETENAIRAANEYLSEKYDGHTMNSMYGDLTAADRDLMTDASNDYEDAVARQDWKAAQEDVDFYAEQNGFDTQEKAYHGTDSFGFTEFDMEQSQDMIFVAYSKDMAGTYVSYEDPSVKKVSEAVKLNKPVKEMSGQELFETAKKYLKTIEGSEVLFIDYDPKSDMYTVTTDESNYFDPNATVTQEFIEYDIKHYLQSNIDELSAGIYQFYTRPGNQLVIDADTTSWDDIPVSFSDETMSTREIAEWARNNGYDSVRINGIWDYGGNGPDLAGYGDIGIFFNQNDVKSADPVTYDDNGNVIPLDQRFSDSSDIRYSTEGELSAADRDIMEEQNLNQTLAESGALTAEEIAAYDERYHKRPLEGRRATEGEAQRAFGDVGGMLEKSDEIANFAKSVVKAQNTYFPDTNFDQINRAVDWIKSQKGGYAEALEKVTSDSFDYRSADGQARMVAMMGLAAAKNDVIAQASLADAFNRQGTDLGRALQARKLFMLMTPEGRKSTLRKMLQNAKDEMGKQGKNVDLTFSEWIYEAAAAAETQEDMRLVQQAALASLGEQLPSNWKDRLNSIRMLSMLANPRTHIRNIIGNAMFIPAVSLKNKLGAVMELGVKQGEKTKTLKPIASKEARAFAREDAETIKGLLTGEAKYSEAAQIKQNQAPLGQFMKVLSDLNSNFLESEDWFFLKGHYRRALSGWMEANGYTADQLRSDQALLEKGRQYAINEAQKATYRDFSKTAQILNSVSRKGGLPGFIVDAALPFKKTPANILRRGIEYSPAGIVKSLSYDLVKMKQYLDYQNGKLDVLPEKALSPTQVIDHICSGLSGTAITALGFLLAGSGAVSCGLDDDEDKFEKAKGNQEYAIKAKLFGHDVTFTLDWAAPMSMPFFVGAAVREQMEKEGNVNVEDAFNAFGGILEPVFNLSMLDGINTLFKTSSYDSNTNPIMQILEKIGTNYISSFVPSALGAVARTIDDTKRKSFVPSDQSKGFVGNLRYAHENAQNKIPFYNQQNIPVRDIWGNEDRTGFVERLLENFILPGYINEYKEDPIINEMARLYEATGDKSMIPQADPDKTISYTVKSTKENVKHVLTDKEWDKYKEVRGKTAFNELTDLLNNPDYQNASDATQVQMIKDIWSHANKVGQKAVIPDIDVDDSNVATIAKDSKISSTKNEMIKALNARDYDAYDTMVQALYDEGLEESDVRAKIRDYYREQYKDAYRKKMKDRISEIKEILNNTGIDFSDLIDNWQEAVDEEKDNSASANPARYIASTGMSDSSFSNRTASMPERPSSDNDWDQYMSDLDDYWADYDFASNDPVGQYGQGNIDLDNRQTVQNDDGSISTEQSFSFYDEQTGKEVLIPLVADGRVMTQDEAIDRYYETGEYLGMFDDWHDADEYATMLHNRQDWYYHQ